MKALIKILFRTHITIKIEPVEEFNYQYRYLFFPTKELSNHQSSREQNEMAELTLPVQRTNSLNASEFSMNSSTFCKAFPWHFIMNDKLQLLQMGKNLWAPRSL